MTLVLVKRLPHAEGLPLPKRMTPGSSGCDVAAAIPEGESMTIPKGGRALVPTGLIFEIPEGFEVQVRPRSGLAVKNGVTVLNSPGTIDADYRGEVKVLLVNLGDAAFTVNRGDRIAQLVTARVARELDFEESAQVKATARGDGGFGHTGT
jgi:dUTP pyrophosphatase